MASKGIKGFYRQKKTSSDISKKKSVKSPIGYDPITLIHISSSPNLQEEEYEEKLRQFDLDMKYGPCIGLTRMERWDRASSLRLNPPADVEAILLKVSGDEMLGPNECIWVGRV